MKSSNVASASPGVTSTPVWSVVFGKISFLLKMMVTGTDRPGTSGADAKYAPSRESFQ